MPAPYVIENPADMRAWSRQVRQGGGRIAFVPTMGYLHEGHVALLREARMRGDRLVMSLFVNPTQFGPSEDLARYPRDFAGDLAKAAGAGVDVVFAPSAADMYPPEHQTFVEVTGVSQGLCGDRRPGHFRGVATVVAKLFGLVQPAVAVFGEKDYQQLMVIRRMVADLAMDIEIVGLPTVREADGLAMSSRNSYLNAEERARAAALFAALEQARTAARAGTREVPTLLAQARARLEGAVDRIDYLEIRDAETLAPIADVASPAVMLIAAFVGRTRLIDNLRLP